MFAALDLAGCSCNTSNTFDQRYCESYSGTTVVPAFAIGAAFFALTFLVWRFVWRRGRDILGDEAAGGANRTVDSPTDGGPCATLEQLIASATISGRALEGYDGRWVVELTFVGDEGDDVFVTGWTTREAACREALEELDRRAAASGASQAH